MSTFEQIRVDGEPVRAYVAGDPAAGAPGVVLFHAWWGLNEDVTAFGDRLADAGFAVVAPDFYGGVVASTIEDADRQSSSVVEAVGDATALAAVDHLAGRLGDDARLGTIGFSFGAGWALWTAAKRDEVRASVVYYGSLSGPSLSAASVPVLGHFAESDPYETDEGVAEFEATLRSAGRDVTIHRYPGTGHWFAEPSRDAYRAAAADLAFERTIEFLRRHLTA